MMPESKLYSDTPQKILEAYCKDVPVIAILRGVLPEEVVSVADVILSAGIRVIEVPTNSPDAFVSIKNLVDHYGDQLLIGAGTVVELGQVESLKQAGGRLFVSPNTDPELISSAASHNMIVLPGVATPSDAFLAIKAGATAIKLFPASTYGSGHVKALNAVLPKHIGIYAVGGVGATNFSEWKQAGISGIGVGSQLFKPSMTLQEIKSRATTLVTAINNYYSNNNI